MICTIKYFIFIFFEATKSGAKLLLLYRFGVQQGLEMRGFWFQKKSVQLKTAFLEVTPM